MQDKRKKTAAEQLQDFSEVLLITAMFIGGLVCLGSGFCGSAAADLSVAGLHFSSARMFLQGGPWCLIICCCGLLIYWIFQFLSMWLPLKLDKN
jgi:hypothetical protein